MNKNNLNQSGFTLIEVLVSVFVLTLGVIGVAGMQLTALRTTQQSNLQVTALQLAAEMADKMRANTSQMKLADEQNLFLDVDYQSASDATLPPPGKTCYASACGADALAQFDIYEWEMRVKSALPGGRVRICRDADPWDSTIKAFKWACSASTSDAGNASMVIKIGWQGKNPDGSLIKGGDNTFPPGIAITAEPYTK